MLQLHPDTVHYVRALHGLDTEERLKESLDLLEEWLQKQDHFNKKDFSRDYLEHMLIAAKGSLEKTKKRLDRLCTYKTLMPQFFEDIDPKTLEHHGKVFVTVSPKLTSDHTRIMLTSNHGTDYTTKTLLDIYKYAVMLADYVLFHDYASQYEVVLDYRGCSMASLLAALSLTDLSNLATILVEGYGVRIKRVHLLSESKFLDVLLKVGRQVVPAKIRSRIALHQSLDSLHELLDPGVLPAEYGGNDIPFKQLSDKWLDTLSSPEVRQSWRENTKACIDEKKRPTDHIFNHCIGISGSFRSLTLD